jgi:hypothetical protein
LLAKTSACSLDQTAPLNLPEQLEPMGRLELQHPIHQEAIAALTAMVVAAAPDKAK